MSAPPVIQPTSCPVCGNRDLARYTNAVSCAACGWSNAKTVELQSETEPPGRIGAFLAWLLKLYFHFRVEISVKAKCPACGHRTKHEIKWVPQFQKVLHICAVCKAPWGESPLVSGPDWAIENEQPRQTQTGQAETRS